MQAILNLGLKSSLLAVTVLSGAVITTSAYLLGEYKFFNTVANQISDYMSPVVTLFPKAQQGFNSLTSKSVDWVTKISSTAKDYAVSLATKAGKSETWEKGTKKLFESTIETLKQQLNTDSIIDFLNNNVFDKDKILSIISDIHGKIIPNFSKVLSSLTSIVTSLSTGALSPSSIKGLWGQLIEGKSLVEALKNQVTSLAQQLKDSATSEEIKTQLKTKAEELTKQLSENVKTIVTQLLNLINSGANK